MSGAWPAESLYFLTVCSGNHVPFARTLIQSVTRQHGAVPFVVAVVDAPSRDAVAIDDAIVLTGRDVFGDDLDYLALKFNASQLCHAAKPFLIHYVLRHSPAERLVYLDSDMYVFAPLDALIAKLDGADLVVTPQTIAPLPDPENFLAKPNIGDLASAGVFNAGMFAVRRTSDSLRFVETYRWLAAAPGAFMRSLGSQEERHVFNWISSFTESFAVLRDTAYNVGYANLHDRSLRYDDGQWTVDGKPLAAFHFSGFSLEQPYQLSRFQNRYSFYLWPALARLRDFYVETVQANDRGELRGQYGFDAFPSGVPIDERMREVFRTYEVAIREDVSPWTAEGEAYYCRALLSPLPQTRTLLPALLVLVHRDRPDLAILGDVSLDPQPLVRWMLSSGAAEHGYVELLDRHRPAVPTHHGALCLAALRKQRPELFYGLEDPLRNDHRTFLARLREVDADEALRFERGAYEIFITSPIAAVRQFLDSRADVRAAFPDFLFADGAACAEWLRDKRGDEHFLPVEATKLFAARVGGRPLARVFSFFSRTWRFMESWPLALVGVQGAELARALLEGLEHTREYDQADVELWLWQMEVAPWAGVPLTLELPLHTTRHPSSRSREGQDEILAPVLARESRFAEALEEYRRRYPPIEDRAPRSQRTASEVSVFAQIGKPPRPPAGVKPVAPGANVFGFHRSDSGLGQMTRGLVQSLAAVGCETSEVVLSDTRMDPDLAPEHYIQTYDPAKGTNIYVSYVHLQDSLLRTMPDAVIEGHRNIAYLAWEQREGHHDWATIYSEYDQLWALSDFTAESLTNILGRKVHSVPCVVDVASYPPPAPKEAYGIDPGVYTFLYVFDANSSIERKNPEAAVEAFREAFGDSAAVRLIVKSSSIRQMANRARLQRLLDSIRAHANVELRAEDVSRKDLYGLISTCDAYVSLHRAEGFAYTCAEAMAYGKPVIATAYSGNLQYMNESNSYLVHYREVENRVQEPPFQRGSLWAEPDVEHAAALMRHVYENRDEAAARGALGRATIGSTLSPAAVGARITKLLSP